MSRQAVPGSFSDVSGKSVDNGNRDRSWPHVKAAPGIRFCFAASDPGVS